MNYAAKIMVSQIEWEVPTDHRPTSHRIATYFIAAYGYFVFVSTDSGWWVVLEKSNNRQNSMEWGQRKR